MEGSISSSAAESLLQNLTNKGWCFADIDQVKSIATVHSVSGLESELCNLDLRSVGGKSLPDSSLLIRKSLNLRVPIVLQAYSLSLLLVASAKDVSRSSYATGSNNRRLLKLMLTDGHTELTAIEYSYIPSLPDDVVPGTKIRLEKKPVVHSGILCLIPGDITVLGGVVQTLFEEWEINQKYLGFSRSSVKPARESEASGPPPFEKLQTGRSKPSSSRNAFQDDGSKVVEAGAGSGTEQINKQHILGAKAAKMDNDPKGVSASQGIEEKPSTSQSRPKEVVEFAPVQNQAAAQKLLQKMTQPVYRQHQRGQRYKGKEEEDKPVFTLDEWERRKAGGSNRVETPDLSRDEDLARQLQSQFDLEDEVQMDPHPDAAAALKMSMFSFEKEDHGGYGRTGSRGTGRGRGRSRGRGRGRPRGGCARWHCSLFFTD
ncbi:hypothetical protein V2J09_002434 [Rumex salicifolius]